MTITVPPKAAQAAQAALARVRAMAPNAFGGHALPPIAAEAPKVPHPIGLALDTGVPDIKNPYKPSPGATGYVNPGGKTLPLIAAPSRLGVPPSHLLGAAMSALRPRPQGGTIIIDPPSLLGPPIVQSGGSTGFKPPAFLGPPITAKPSLSGHPIMPLPKTGVLPVISSPVLPTVAKGTVPMRAPINGTGR